MIDFNEIILQRRFTLIVCLLLASLVYLLQSVFQDYSIAIIIVLIIAIIIIIEYIKEKISLKRLETTEIGRWILNADKFTIAFLTISEPTAGILIKKTTNQDVNLASCSILKIKQTNVEISMRKILFSLTNQFKLQINYIENSKGVFLFAISDFVTEKTYSLYRIMEQRIQHHQQATLRIIETIKQANSSIDLEVILPHEAINHYEIDLRKTFKVESL